MSENTRGRVILVVDDSVAIRKQVKAILEKAQYTVREAGNEIGMLNMMEEYGKCADLIMMDVNLGTTTGFELIEKLRAVDKYAKLPVLMLTQHSDRENVSMAKMARVQGYLVKPINPDMLLERISQIFNQQV